jgi:S1-C subfamily serine protease
VAEQIAAGNASATVHIGPTAFLGTETPAGPLYGSGATIVGVVSGGSAANAGLMPGDTIVALDGRIVTSPAALTQRARRVPLPSPRSSNRTSRYRTSVCSSTL